MENKEIEYHKYLNKLMIIKNSISLNCFTTLAIVFKHWWIVFFALLFMPYIDKEEK